MEDSGKFIEKMMELGIGLSVIKSMPDLMNGMMAPMAASGHSQSAPPPVQSGGELYVAIDGMQAGPFSENDMIRMIQNGIVVPSMLVWKAGMSNWTPASQVPEVNRLFLLSKIK